MFAIGSTVKNKINNRIGTVTHILDDGMIRVRFDGDTGTRPLHYTRFASHAVDLNDVPSNNVDPETFKTGDHIQVTDPERGTVKGTALTELNSFGLSGFDMLTEDGQYLTFNANHVAIVVLFRADIARGDLPKY